MKVQLKVRRFDPERDGGRTYFQEYSLEVEDYFTVLDTLIRVREEVDETLALRCSCRASICGSCAMRINGHAGLACKTRVRPLMERWGMVLVEPLGNLPVVKDLVVDLGPFWERVKAVEPWLQPPPPPPQGEYIASNEAMLHLVGVMACIMCGACVSDCTVLEVDKNFLGPAALAKAYRFLWDPRDEAERRRLSRLNQYGGIWDCTRCFECVQACPKGVAPMERIMAMRARAVAAGFTHTTGARHTIVFTDLVKHSGRLDELRLAIRTPGLFNIRAQLRQLPVGLRALRRGKMPPLFHKPIPGVERVRRIFEKVEGGS